MKALGTVLIAIALLLLTAPAQARWIVRYEWVEDATPFYAPVLLQGRATWGERPAWCRHGRHWSCRP